MRFPTLRAVDSITKETIIFNSLLNKKRLLQFLLMLSLKIRCSLLYFHLTNLLRAHAFVRKKRPPDYLKQKRSQCVECVTQSYLLRALLGAMDEV
jgi:hypothetical protein